MSFDDDQQALERNRLTDHVDSTDLLFGSGQAEDEVMCVALGNWRRSLRAAAAIGAAPDG